MPPGFGYA